MATATITISDKINFVVSYTFENTYAATGARVSAYISSVTATSTLAHPYTFLVDFWVDDPNEYGYGTTLASGTILKNGTTDIDSEGTQRKTITRTHASASHTIVFRAYLIATDDVTITHNKKSTVSVTVPARPSYKITFDANGGSGGPSYQTKWHDEALTLTSSKPTRTGHTFSHWDTQSDGSGTNYSSGGTYPKGNNAAATLHAYWNIIKYTISYSANGGSGAPSAQTKNYGATATISSTVPTRTGYNFVEWRTKSDGTGTAYSGGDSYSTNANLTLYAKWAKKTYTVSYSASGASNVPSSQTKTHDTALKLSTTKPTKTNYVFKEWRTNSDGTGTAYSPGDSYTGNANVTLYAQWYAPYTVSYSANGGSGAPSAQTKVYNQALTLSSTTPTRTNYVFKNWKATNGTSYNPGDSYTANASTTMTAQWYAPYTVSYDANGGGAKPDSQTKPYNGSVAVASVPTSDASKYKQNCTFGGWNTKADGSGTNYAGGANYTANANVTLYAKWTTAYASPTVSITKIYRANSSGNASDEGTYLALEGTYNVYDTGSNSHSWSATCHNVTVNTPASGGTAKSGSYKFVINANLSTSSSYSATVTLTDNATGAPGVGNVAGNHSGTTASQTKSIGSAAYPIDIGKFDAGYGVAFNGVASRVAMDIGFADTHFGDVSASSMRLMAHTQHRDGKIIEVKPNTTNADGDALLIGAGGPTFIGGGESDTNLYAALGITPASNEDLYLASDGMIKLYTNCQTIANRKYCWLGTDGSAGIRQSLNTYSNNTDVVIGTSSNNGVNENKTIGSLYLRDNSGTWTGVIGSRTDSSSGDIHTYIGANNTKTDGTTVQAYLDVIVKKDGTRTYSVSDAGAFRNAIGATSGVWAANHIPLATTSAQGAITAAEKKKLNAISVGTAAYLYQIEDTSSKRWRLCLTNADPANLRADVSTDGGSTWSSSSATGSVYFSKTDHTHTLSASDITNALGYTLYSASASRTANTVLAAPNGSAGTASFRKLVAADIPTLTMSKISDAGTLAKKSSGTVAVDADVYTESFTKKYSINANATATVQMTGVSRDNCSVVGIRRLTSGAQSAIGVIGWYLDGTTLNVYMKNFTSTKYDGSTTGEQKTAQAVVCFAQTSSLSRAVSFS